MTFSIFTEAFDPKKKASRILGHISRTGYGSRSGGGTYELSDRQRETVASVLDAVQTIVDTLGTPEERYVASFWNEHNPSSVSVGGTDLRGKRIIVSSAPLFDKQLTLGQAAEVLTGIVCHEIGHTKLSADLQRAFEKKYGKPPEAPANRPWLGAPTASPAYRLADWLKKLLEDERLERYMSERYPGIGNAFRPTAAWVGRTSLDPKGVLSYHKGLTIAQALNFAIASVRFPFAARWRADTATRAERQWWQDWADEYSVDVKSILVGIDVAMARLIEPEPPQQEQAGSGGGDAEDKPETEEPEQQPGSSSSGDDDSDDDDSDEQDDEGNSSEGDDADDDDGQGEDDDEDSDEAGGNDSLGATEGGTNSDDDDQQSESESSQGDVADADPDAQHSEGEGANSTPGQPGDETDDDSDEVKVNSADYDSGDGGDGTPPGSNSIATGDAKPELRDPNFKDADVLDGIDEKKQPKESDYDQKFLDQALQQAVKQERESLPIESRGGFGKVKVHFNF